MNGTISIMWKRQLKLYFRSKFRIIGSLIQPVLFLVAFGFGFGSVFKQAGMGNYIQFLVPGIIGITILFGGILNGISLILDKQYGFLKETLVAPVPRINILIGRSLGGATTSTIQGLLILIIGFIVGFSINNWLLFLLGIFVMFIASLLFTLIGISIASKVNDVQAFPIVINFLVMPMFFLSGALFPIKDLPTFLKWIVYINPMTYVVDLLQFSFNSTAKFLYLDIIVILFLLIIISIIGNSLFNKIEP